MSRRIISFDSASQLRRSPFPNFSRDSQTPTLNSSLNPSSYETYAFPSQRSSSSQIQSSIQTPSSQKIPFYSQISDGQLKQYFLNQQLKQHIAQFNKRSSLLANNSRNRSSECIRKSIQINTNESTESDSFRLPSLLNDTSISHSEHQDPLKFSGSIEGFQQNSRISLNFHDSQQRDPLRISHTVSVTPSTKERINQIPLMAPTKSTQSKQAKATQKKIIILRPRPKYVQLCNRLEQENTQPLQKSSKEKLNSFPPKPPKDMFSLILTPASQSQLKQEQLPLGEEKELKIDFSKEQQDHEKLKEQNLQKGEEFASMKSQKDLRESIMAENFLKRSSAISMTLREQEPNKQSLVHQQRTHIINQQIQSASSISISPSNVLTAPTHTPLNQSLQQSTTQYSRLDSCRIIRRNPFLKRQRTESVQIPLSQSNISQNNQFEESFHPEQQLSGDNSFAYHSNLNQNPSQGDTGITKSEFTNFLEQLRLKANESAQSRVKIIPSTALNVLESLPRPQSQIDKIKEHKQAVIQRQQQELLRLENTIQQYESKSSLFHKSNVDRLLSPEPEELGIRENEFLSNKNSNKDKNEGVTIEEEINEDTLTLNPMIEKQEELIEEVIEKEQYQIKQSGIIFSKADFSKSSTLFQTSPSRISEKEEEEEEDRQTAEFSFGIISTKKRNDFPSITVLI